AVHLVSVFALVGVAVVQLVKQAGLSSPALQVLMSVAFALGATYAYARFDAVGTWAQFTAVLPAIALGSFVFLSPTSDVIAPPEAAGAEGEGGGEDAPSVMVLMLDELPTESLLADDG